MLFGYGVNFAWRTPEFDDPTTNAEVKWVFALLLIWHLVLVILKLRERVYDKKIPFVTVLMLIQLSIVCFLLERWVCDPPLDSQYDTPARIAWRLWVLFEVTLPMFAIANTLIYLLLRALKMDPSVSAWRNKKSKD